MLTFPPKNGAYSKEIGLKTEVKLKKEERAATSVVDFVFAVFSPSKNKTEVQPKKGKRAATYVVDFIFAVFSTSTNTPRSLLGTHVHSDAHARQEQASLCRRRERERLCGY